jgi:hypothetical protein
VDRSSGKSEVHGKQNPSTYGPRHAAYDLQKLRGKQILRRIGHSRRYEPLPTGLRAMTRAARCSYGSVITRINFV